MVSCTGQCWLRAVRRANIRIQLSALRAAADTGRYPYNPGSDVTSLTELEMVPV
jgi:hypothetical protein